MAQKDAGNTAFRSGRYGEAYELYTAALAEDTELRSPFMAKLACNRAVAGAKLGRHSDAARDAALAIGIDDAYCKVGRSIALTAPSCILYYTYRAPVPVPICEYVGLNFYLIYPLFDFDQAYLYRAGARTVLGNLEGAVQDYEKVHTYICAIYECQLCDSFPGWCQRA